MSDLVITAITAKRDDDMDLVDVAFTYDAGLTGIMTVWIETDGSLYGEW